MPSSHTIPAIMQNDAVDDDIQAGYTDAPQFDQSNAQIAGQIDENGHLQANDMWGVQTRSFRMCTPDDMTLEKLAASAKNGYLWQMPAEEKKYLKQVGKMTNRSDVSDKDLHGDLDKALFLTATIVGFWNESTKPIALDIGGLMPTMHTSTGRHTYVINPTGGAFTVINKSIMEPDNLFTKHMYEHNQKCDLTTLKRHIRLEHDPEKQVALMDSNGIGWKVLVDNMRSEDSPFASALDTIYAKNPQLFDQPETEHTQWAVVPYAIAQQVYDAIAAPLNNIEKSYINLSTWKVKFSPANKQAWNSISGLAKESVVYGTDSTDVEVQSKLHTPFSCGVEVVLSYVLGK